MLGSQNITVNIRNTSPVLVEFTVGARVVWEITGIINVHNRLKLQCRNATKETYTVLQRLLFLPFLPRENIKYKCSDSGKHCVCRNRNASVASVVNEEDSGMRRSLKSERQTGTKACRAL